MIPLIQNPFGIGNRVAAMAQALAHCDSIKYQWRNNAHLPLEHYEVFPNGVTGVEFVSPENRDETPWCSWTPPNGGDHEKRGYQAVMDSMVGNAGEPPEVAIMARFFRFPETSIPSLAEIAAKSCKPVFIFADSRRSEIATELGKYGIESIFPITPEMTRDNDRPPETVISYLSDWKRALSAGVIVTTNERSSSVYPAMAAGKEILAKYVD